MNVALRQEKERERKEKKESRAGPCKPFSGLIAAGCSYVTTPPTDLFSSSSFSRVRILPDRRPSCELSPQNAQVYPLL
jgi:hypothetical protein